MALWHIERLKSKKFLADGGDNFTKYGLYFSTLWPPEKDLNLKCSSLTRDNLWDFVVLWAP